MPERTLTILARRINKSSKITLWKALISPSCCCGTHLTGIVSGFASSCLGQREPEPTTLDLSTPPRIILSTHAEALISARDVARRMTDLRA